MYKKRILGLAIASAIALTGCLDNSEPESQQNVNANQNLPPDPNDGDGANLDGESLRDIADENADGVWPIFNPALSLLPIPNDLIFDSTASDGSFFLTDTTPPVTTALNRMSGASTSAAIDIALSGLIDDATVSGSPYLGDGVTPNPNQNVFLIELSYESGSPLQGLSMGEPPNITPTVGNAYSVEALTLGGSSTLRILPSTALKPNTRYIVIVTDEISDADGEPLRRSPGLTGYETLRDTGAVLADPALGSVRSLITGLWETVGTNYFGAATNLSRAAFALEDLTADNIVMSYSFMTSGDEKVLEYIANPTEWFTDQLNTFVRVSATKASVGFVDEDTGEDFSPGGDDFNAALFGDITDDGINFKVPDPDADPNFLDVRLAANTAVALFPDADTAAALPTLFGVGAPCNGLTGAAAISCASTALATSFAALLPTPTSRTTTFDDANAQLAAVKSALLGSFDSTNAVTVVEGNIQLPYYLETPPDNVDGSAIMSAEWLADDSLATSLNAAFASVGLALPQADPDTSTVLNYVFPFPKPFDVDGDGLTGLAEVLDGDADTDDRITSPLLATYNTAAVTANVAGSNLSPVIVYQHGVRIDRSAMLPFATSMSANGGYAVIGLDQPVHGIIAPTATEQDDLASTLLDTLIGNGIPLTNDQASRDALVAGLLNNGFVQGAVPTDAVTAAGIIATVIGGGTSGDPGLDAAIIGIEGSQNAAANAGSTVPGIGPTTLTDTIERHFDFTANALGQPVPLTDAGAVGGTGSLFINLLDFTNSRDKLRQGSVDIMNLLASLGTIDLDGDGDADLDTTRVYFAGQSLGTINGIPAVTAWNASGQTPAVVAMAPQVPGGGIAKLLENSNFFASTIVGGLAAAGILQGSSNFESFMNVIQGTLDSVDPINFADNINAGCAFDNTVTTAGLNTFQTCTSATNIVLHEISGSATRLSDLTIPNETFNNTLNDVPTARSALAGTDPLVEALGLSNVLDGATAAGVSRYNAGTHGTPVLPVVTDDPINDPTEATDGADAATRGAERAAVFNEIVTQSITLFAGGATGATNAAILNTEAEHDALRAP